MQRTYELNSSELIRSQQLESSYQQALARIGAATLELETCKAQLPQLREQQRQLTQEVVARTGARDYLRATIEGQNLLVTLPDESMEVSRKVMDNGIER